MTLPDFNLAFVANKQNLDPRQIQGEEVSLPDVTGMRHVLLNYATCKSTEVSHWKTNGRMDLVIGDSGGLQSTRFGKEYDPTEISKWYNKNAHYGLALDVVPWIFSGSSNNDSVWMGDDPKVLERCALQTRDNVRKMKAAQEDYKLYYIYQGNNYEQFKFWHERSEPDIAQGVALKQTKDFHLNAEILCFLWEHFKDKPVHFLGVGATVRYLPIIYLASFWKAPITADSTRYKWGALSRIYECAMDPLNIELPGSVAASYRGAMPCDCKACKLMEKYPDSVIDPDCDEQLKVLGDKMMMGHNINIHVKRVEFYKRLAQNPEMFVEYCNKTRISDKESSNGVIENFGFVDLISVVSDLNYKGVQYVKDKYAIGASETSAYF